MCRTSRHGLLITDALVSKPIIDLCDRDAALARQFFLGLLARIWVGQMRVEILVEDFCGFFAEVSSFAPSWTSWDDVMIR